MWKFIIFFVLSVNLCHAFPNKSTDIESDENELYDKSSTKLSEELEYIGRIWISSVINETQQDPLKINGEINVQKLSTSAVHVWQRLAQENNVTIEKLMTILQFSRKLRILKLQPETEETKNKTGEYFQEACEQYVPAQVADKIETTTVSTTTTKPPDFLESLASAIFKPIGIAVVLNLQAEAFVNATTTADKLEIFENMCKVFYELNPVKV